ncbi:class I SAM-dependent methyltransferase [Rhodopila sp.]|uniref:class I SAM-dependent methyltransferase n=1 Tax=Rhodopila sp. TaxID=2480087 RepID=UPI002B6F31AD|nr:class I SAM-dependent methyltransferase [Rhodopila sp.]HVZ10503.1 class I SAM-dependent methyltransferase [Rhodopila sp.]
MRILADRFHCPRCKGRLAAVTAQATDGTPAGSLTCTLCDTVVAAPGGIPDFADGRAVAETDPRGLFGDPYISAEDAAALYERMRGTAGADWPAGLGDVLDLGCGGGRLTLPVALSGGAHTIVAADSRLDALRACRDRITQIEDAERLALGFARFSLAEDVLRDASFDTVLGLDVMTRARDTRALLDLTKRVLRPGGRAFFVVANRRYLRAFCRAMAEALVLRHARDQAWSDAARTAIHMIGVLHRRDIHHDHAAAAPGLMDRTLFDPEELRDMALEAGFQTAETRPVEPDPVGGETALRLCREAGIDDGFAADVVPLAASAGAPYFQLLGRPDAAATMLLCLRKGIGPSVRTFAAQPRRTPVTVRQPEAALGGMPPRWSIEATARETRDGLQLTVDGWCLANADIVWVRFTIDDTTRATAIGHPRPDVHDVLNRQGFYHKLNALCSGLRATLLYDGVHAHDGQCAVRIEVALANGLIVQAPASRQLPLNETVTLAQ